MLRDVEMAALRNAVKSLAESTELLVESAGVLAVLRGRNSPYASHRTVEYHYAYRKNGPILAANHRHIIAIEPHGALIEADGLPLTLERDGTWGWDDEREAAWVSKAVPPLLVEPVMATLRRYGLVGEIRAPLITLAWPVPVLERWDEEGRPVYRIRCSAEVAVS